LEEARAAVGQPKSKTRKAVKAVVKKRGTRKQS